LTSNSDIIKWVEVHYADVVGRLRIVYTSFSDEIIANADGSSIGVERVESSDVLVIGDQKTLVKLPWSSNWGRVIGCIYRDRTSIHELDSRSVAQRVEEYILENYGLTPLMGVELEFFVFRDISVNYSSPLSLSYVIKPIDKCIKGVFTGYHTTSSTLDSYRSSLVETLTNYFYINVKCHHHEVASSQVELTLEPVSHL